MLVSSSKFDKGDADDEGGGGLGDEGEGSLGQKNRKISVWPPSFIYLFSTQEHNNCTLIRGAKHFKIFWRDFLTLFLNFGFFLLIFWLLFWLSLFWLIALADVTFFEWFSPRINLVCCPNAINVILCDNILWNIITKRSISCACWVTLVLYQ